MIDPNYFLNDIKNYLDVTWDDLGTDTKITSIISAGCAKIAALTNSSIEIIAKSPEHTELLKEYCRLTWAGVPEKFEEFFGTDMTRLRLRKISEEYDDE